MAVDGVIAERTRGIIPVTWDALMGDSRYGEAPLQAAIDTAKEMVTGEVVSSGAEPSYSLFVIDFIARVGALNLIPAGIDFWMSTPINTGTSGTVENVSFTDRAAALRQLGEDLARYVREHEDEVNTALGFVRAKSSSIPRINTLLDDFITPSHQEFGRPYTTTAFT